MGTFVDWPVTCRLCGWHGYESGMRDHVKDSHPDIYEQRVAVSEIRKRKIKEDRKKRSWLWRLWYWPD